MLFDCYECEIYRSDGLHKYMFNLLSRLFVMPPSIEVLRSS
jgi:hypothetical protein